MKHSKDRGQGEIHELRVRARRIVARGGDVTSHRSVHCPRREGAVAVSECLLCVDCEGIRARPDGVYLACRQDDAGRSALDALRKRRRLPSAADRTPLSAVMTGDVVCVRPDLSIEALMTLFEDCRVSGVPVVDADGSPLGVVSKTDLVRAELEVGDLRVSESWPPPVGFTDSADLLESGFHVEPGSRGTVDDIMMPIAFTMLESASLSHAAALMACEGVHRVVVVGVEGTVVGIVSALDVVRWLAEQDGYLLPARAD